MKIVTKKMDIATNNQIEFIDLTENLQEVIANAGVKEGVMTVFSPHSTASIIINHNEPMLLQDMTRLLYRLVPSDERYAHDMFELTSARESDGRSNSHSHCKNIILSHSVSIPFQEGAMLIGPRQSVFFVELDGGRARDYVIQIIGQ